MTDPVSLDKPLKSDQLHRAFELLQQKKLDEAKILIEEVIAAALAKKDSIQLALAYSAMGIYHKINKDFKAAWKSYEQAEKILPDDPSLKIISSRFLVEIFGQHDTAIRKLEKVLAFPGLLFPFAHQAHTIMGLAYLKSGDKKKAVQKLQESMGEKFKDLGTSYNLDLALVLQLIKRSIDKDLCREFLETGRQLAINKGEREQQNVLTRLLDELFTA